MGRLIHTNDLHNAVMMNKSDWGIFGVTIDNLIEGVVSQVPTIDAIPKDQYEVRLMTDMVAMLTELQLEIEESENCGKAFHLGLQMASNIIQQRINALKGKQKGKNEVEGRN